MDNTVQQKDMCFIKQGPDCKGGVIAFIKQGPDCKGGVIAYGFKAGAFREYLISVIGIK